LRIVYEGLLFFQSETDDEMVRTRGTSSGSGIVRQASDIERAEESNATV
jgi:hypothetical protein